MTSISVDLDTLEEVRYKMRSFLVGEPTKTNVPKAPSSCREGAAALCCICLDEIKKNCMIVSMPLCGHLYHKACLFNWVDLSKNTFCPYCRQDDF